MTDINLRIPGPTPLPPEVREALAQQVISHRSSEYRAIHSETVAMAQEFFQTKNDVFLFTSSGTGTMEAAIVNTLSSGDTAIGVTIGVFGKRALNVAKAYGITIVELSYPMGQAAKPEEIAEAVKKHPEAKAIIITHNETSTAIENDIPVIVKAVRAVGNPLFLVDSISALGNVDLPVDELALDVVYTSTQKAWMSPPGLALISVGPRAWEAAKTAKCPRYYFDFAKMKKYHDHDETPETPGVSNLFALHAALKLMKQKGVKETFAYYSELSAYTKKKLQDSGFTLFGDQAHASKTVTAFLIPEGTDDKTFRGTLKSKYGVILSGGKGETEGKIARIAHMGWVSKKDIDDAIEVMVKVKKELANV